MKPKTTKTTTTATKTISRQVVLLLVLAVIAGSQLPTASAVRCDRTPEGSGASKSPADGRFRLRISGNPDKYVPGESYTISLVGIRSMQVPHKFSGFFLAAERELSLNRPELQGAGGGNGLHNVGTFHLLGDALTKFSERCPNAVTQTSSIPKSEIQVNWIAPPAGSGCIAIRATVVEHRDVWYMDDGPLSKIFCEDEADSVDTQPPVLKECCACDEAKYELTFEGLWSRHTHPKDFPSNGWLTRFSDVIGASHTVDYRFWEYGQVASEGLKQVAEHGSTRMLESELKNQSDKIRTIIKARGISYPNVTGKTFAVFRVDSNHHLVSIVSMLDPSPDWIVGVSGLELCLTNCSWIENKILNLYPWDAGTDSGPTYISPDQPTNPPDAIRRIKSNYPNDPRSPFYDPSGAEMKPLARIYLSRQRLYEKNCDSDNEEENENKQACETDSWGEWTECSSRCGKGKQTRRRTYKYPNKAKQADCKKKLFDRRPCVGSERDCDYQTSQELDERYQSDPECELTEWGPWSECSTPCGKGNKTRSRKYKKKGARKKCERMPNPPMLQQTVPCSEECAGDISQAVRSADNNPMCKMTQWSEWGPCSVTCGLGRRMRTRMPISKALNTRMHHKRFVNYYLTKQRPNEDDDDEEEGDEDDGDNSLQIMDANDPCYGMDTVEEVLCGHDLPACDGLYGVPELCFLEPKPGHCRDSQTRWYFDSEKNDCSILFFTGCGGNNNNFMSREDCLDTCSKDRKFTNIPIRDQKSSSDYSADFKQDCKTSHWKRGPCNATCGEGFRTKSRTILVHPANGGQRCPRKLRKLERCFVHCDSSRHDTNPSWGPSTRYSPEPIECEYSAWSAWSPCSKTCGDFAVQQRTRYVLNPENARYCPHRLEERKCDIMPCLLGN